MKAAGGCRVSNSNYQTPIYSWTAQFHRALNDDMLVEIQQPIALHLFYGLRWM
jgi:hypothetical protein